jgi:hypothetical protein
MATKLLGALFLLLAFAGIAFGVGTLLFYRGGYEPPTQARIAASEISEPVVPVVQPYEAPVARRADGLLLVDALHKNNFAAKEIVSLRSKVADLGYDVEFLGDFGNVQEKSRLTQLEEQLRGADSFLVILPREEYTEAEARLVEGFVRKGGNLLLISEPTRPDSINTLAKRFGVNFQPDYLYNQVENDGNFKHIFIRDFQPEEITAGLNGVALYTAGSIRSSGPGLAFTDDNTTSSLLENADSYYPMAWGNTRNVLAIGDITFMIPPQDVVLDNDRLLSNIADYLTAGDREFDLSDFPHFLGSGSDGGVDILLGRPTLLSSGAGVKTGLATQGVTADIRGVEDVSRDTVFLGLHEDAYKVDRYLRTAGISVDDVLSGSFGMGIELEGTAVTILDRSQQRDVLIILADTPENLGQAAERLLSGEFRDDLVSDFAGVSNSP